MGLKWLHFQANPAFRPIYPDCLRGNWNAFSGQNGESLGQNNKAAIESPLDHMQPANCELVGSSGYRGLKSWPLIPKLAVEKRGTLVASHCFGGTSCFTLFLSRLAPRETLLTKNRTTARYLTLAVKGKVYAHSIERDRKRERRGSCNSVVTSFPRFFSCSLSNETLLSSRVFRICTGTASRAEQARTTASRIDGRPKYKHKLKRRQKLHHLSFDPFSLSLLLPSRKSKARG